VGTGLRDFEHQYSAMGSEALNHWKVGSASRARQTSFLKEGSRTATLSLSVIMMMIIIIMTMRASPLHHLIMIINQSIIRP
jgi:hypothetical protein